MKVPALQAFSPEVQARLKTEIEANDGQEVTFSGNIDRSGLVYEVEVLAYGNEDSSAVNLADALRGDVLIHNHPTGGLQASAADIQVSSLLANKRIGFYIIDNACETCNIILKPEPRIYLEEEKVSSVFQPGGLLSQCISQFESREEQCRMVEAIVDAINQSRILTCEAGTGTGKSLSYLIPAALWAVQNKKRVMVSTHTINLQQQIARKDMIIVSRIVSEYLGQELEYALLVGKRNYICKRNLYSLIRDHDKQSTLFEDATDYNIVYDIENWMQQAEEGTRGEYGEYIRDDVWDEICCDSATCTRRACAHYSECFYFKARLQAEKAHIIIANHSLVFATIDEESLTSSLPHFSGCIFDEAHHVEDAALKALSRDFSFQGLLYHLYKLYQKKKGQEKGLLVLLRRRGAFEGYPELREAYMRIVEDVERLLANCHQLHQDLREKFSRLSSFESATIGFDDDFVESHEYLYAQEQLSGLMGYITRLSKNYDDFAEHLKEFATDGRIIEIMKSVSYRLQSLGSAASIYELVFHSEPDPSYVRWIELSRKNIRFAYAPLEVGDFLVNSLFSRKDFTVFASATLMINHRFEYFKNSLGLAMTRDKEKQEISLPSPFDYSTQAEIHILNEKLSHSSHSQEKTELVRQLSLISGGGVLVLFTSYTRLREMYDELSDELMEAGLYPMRQGEKSRDELLRIMKSRPYAVLFATSSFWEGVDIQGENLRCVIIEKLPFDNPSDPLYQAKVALLETRGINAFTGYSLPRAVLRLKQGLGRLIRSRSDKGIIALMDDRIQTKKYGSVFLNSLPPARVIYGSVQELSNEAERFFGHHFGGVDFLDRAK